MSIRSAQLAETFAALMSSNRAASPRLRPIAPGVAAFAAVAAALLMITSPQPANAELAGLFGGGPYYKTGAATHVAEIKAAGFTEAIVWNIEVKSNGDLNFNGEFPLCSGGAYVGATTHSDFVANMAALHQGSVRRVTFSIGSSNVGDWQDVRDLVNAQGTTSTSILYQNFSALLTAIPSVDAFDFDDENCYDATTMVKFAVMLSDLGAHVVPDPYTNASFWTNVVSQINSQRPGCVDSIHLQCYSGGAGNNPGTFANFGSVPVYPGLWDQNLTPSQVQTKLTGWKNQYGTSGGWMWIYDDFVGNGKAAQYANAIHAAFITTYEAENLTLAAKSADTHRIVGNSSFSNGYSTILDATAAGDFVTYTVNVPQARTYDVRVGAKLSNNRGIFQYSSNGVNHGNPVDLYSATASYTEVDVGNTTFSSSGNKSFQFLVTGKNAASAGYTLSFDYIKLVPQ